jgi:hypothetical protein
MAGLRQWEPAKRVAKFDVIAVNDRSSNVPPARIAKPRDYPPKPIVSGLAVAAIFVLVPVCLVAI